MPAAIAFRAVSYSDVLQDFSCEIEGGTRVLIVTAREEESSTVMRLIAGLILPEQGSVVLFDTATGDTSSDRLMQARRRLGMISFHGGLISNLKMGENILLPYHFHCGTATSDVDAYATHYLEQLNCREKLAALPAHLSLYEKRAAAFARAAVMRPDVMVYCNSLERISRPERTCLAAVLDEFHTEKSGRTSVFLTSAPETALQSNFDAVFHIHPQKNPGAAH